MSTRDPLSAAHSANPYAPADPALAAAHATALPEIPPEPGTVAAIMTRHVIAVALDTPLKSVRELFERHRIHHVPVIENNKLVGIISDRDVLKALSPLVDKPAATAHDLATLDKKVHQIMQRGVVTAKPGMPIAEAGQIMLAQSISSLPVLDKHQRCVGIVTSRDFMKWCLQSGCPAAKAA